MFRKILIANRGEIACRVMRTAADMGVRTVAVYSDADANALHVAMADEAVHIGPAPVGESYLRGDKIIAAARKTGAQAIHPGYGFLSENPDFVEDVTAAGLVFVGPSAASIRAMGLKDAAKKLMEDAGVPVVPGYHGADQDPDLLASEAEKIGYPVLIKARAGGGGKGMRLVETSKDFAAALTSAAREGESAFGDPAVLIEKYITSPRHIEVQVFGDAHGNVVHLYERDCSLQRRHQKVIEEAPAPGMSDAVRKAMTDAAVTAAKAIDYQGAGTIEFIVDGAGDLRPDGFWFMEMNTRLQVEHPVTEAITGTDLVAWQLRVAAGAPLPLKQSEIPLQGHAFEARLYAEDPTKDFLPATGALTHLRFGAGRIDTGVRSGDAISPFYDPMIAKVITHGDTRAEALSALTASLDQTHVAGLTTNVSFLSALSQHAGFVAGDVDTGLIGRDQVALTKAQAPTDLVIAIAAACLSGVDFADPYAGWRLWGGAAHRVNFQSADMAIMAEISISPNRALITWDGAKVSLAEIEQDHDSFTATHDGRRFRASIFQGTELSGRTVSILMDGATHQFSAPDPLAIQSTVAGSGDDVIAPMTGAVRSVDVTPGDKVAQGDPVIVLEAMKMEHTLTAPRDGVVAELTCALGDQVADGAVLLRLEAQDD